ncbi:hypothetical protein ACJX0J_032638, partial [Zea mays]
SGVYNFTILHHLFFMGWITKDREMKSDNYMFMLVIFIGDDTFGLDLDVVGFFFGLIPSTSSLRTLNIIQREKNPSVGLSDGWESLVNTLHHPTLDKMPRTEFANASSIVDYSRGNLKYPFIACVKVIKTGK